MKKKIIYGLSFVATICLCLVFVFAPKDIPIENKKPEPQAPSLQTAKEIAFTASVEASYAINPENISELISLNKGSNVIKVKVIEKKNSIFLNEGDPYPVTPYTVEIVKNYTENEKLGEITLYLSGGDVLVKDVIASTTSERAKKMGLTNLDEKAINTQYIRYEGFAGSQNLVDGEEYVMVVSKLSNSDNTNYRLNCDGFGVFKKNISKSPQTALTNEFSDFKNIITGKSFEFPSN